MTSVAITRWYRLNFYFTLAAFPLNFLLYRSGADIINIAAIMGLHPSVETAKNIAVHILVPLQTIIISCTLAVGVIGLMQSLHNGSIVIRQYSMRSIGFDLVNMAILFIAAAAGA